MNDLPFYFAFGLIAAVFVAIFLLRRSHKRSQDIHEIVSWKDE